MSVTRILCETCGAPLCYCKCALPSGPSEGASPESTGPAKVVAAVPTGWGALLSEWKRRLRRLDNDSWHYPTKQRGNELRRCIRELKRALRGHPNNANEPTTGS